MSKTFKRLCSLLIVLCLCINLLPVNALASEIQTEEITLSDTVADNSEDVYILEEVVENRTQYSKDYRLSNGLNIAAVYSDPVHFEKDGQWEEIDNTLKLSTARSGNVYTNTAGEWQVSFPQNISSSQSVTITKDGYTLSFRMAGELYDSDNDVVVSEAPSVPDIENSEAEETMTETEAPTGTAGETEPSASASLVPSEENVEAEKIEVIEESIDNECASIAVTEAVEEPDTVAETESASETEAVIETESEEAAGTVSEQDAMEKLLAEESSFANVQMAPMRERAAEVVPIDLTDIKKAYEYEEIVPEKINSRLKYENIYGNTDVIYDLNSNQVKESIVIGAYNANLRGYSYILETGEMIPVLNANNEIELYDADRQEMIMIMPAPYLFDSNDICSYDVDILLQQTGTGYLLTYSLPREWLADSCRQWPVTLDPVVSSIASNSNAEDQTVYKSGISSSASSTMLNCGYDSSGGGAMRIFMKYKKLPSLTSADIVVDASMSMYALTKNGSGSTVVEVREVLESWSASSVKWSNQPDFKSVVEDYAICSGVSTLTWNITDIVRSWYTDSNYGMVFKAISSVESGSSNNWMRFYSANFTSTHKPILTITYRNNNGLESYWDYTASSAGRAGTGYVNQYTGNLVWVKDILGFGGNRMPVPINIVYNANDSQTNNFGLGYG